MKLSREAPRRGAATSTRNDERRRGGQNLNSQSAREVTPSGARALAISLRRSARKKAARHQSVRAACGEESLRDPERPVDPKLSHLAYGWRTSQKMGRRGASDPSRQRITNPLLSYLHSFRKRLPQKPLTRGAGGSRTHDGGFATRRLRPHTLQPAKSLSGVGWGSSMTVTIACASCGAVHSLSDQAFGRRVQCIRCGHVWRVADLPKLAPAAPPPIPPCAAKPKRRVDWWLWLPLSLLVLVPGTIAAVVALQVDQPPAKVAPPKPKIDFAAAENASPSERIQLVKDWLGIALGSRLVDVTATDETGEANAFLVEWHLEQPLFETPTELVAGADALRIIQLVRRSGAPCENLILHGRFDDRGPRRIILVRRFDRATLQSTDWRKVHKDRVFRYAANRS